VLEPVAAANVGMGDVADERIRESVDSPTGSGRPGATRSEQPANLAPATDPTRAHQGEDPDASLRAAVENPAAAPPQQEG